jgi:hypothetical protein
MMSVAFTREESAETAAEVELLFVALATALKCSIASCFARKCSVQEGRDKIGTQFRVLLTI